MNSLHIVVSLPPAHTSDVRAGLSKFVSGVLGAKVSPSLLLATGLMATASVNIIFGFSSNLVLFCVLWGINGTLQARRCPALALQPC